MFARLLICLAALLPVLAHAQAWPNRPIRFVIPFAQGGLMESVFSVTKEFVEKRLGQRIVVENRPGGGGNVGAQAVLAAAPDGYTILVPPSNVLVTNQFMFANMPFDPLKDFIPITMLVDVPLVLSVSEKFPPRTLREFLEHARANPGRVNYGSPGPATPPHLAAAMLAHAARLDLVHVPYKGGNAAATALITNEVQFMIIGYPSLAGQIQGRLVRPIAVAASERLAALPDVPTFAEAGYADLEAEIPHSWWGLVAPRGTPDAVVQRLYEEFRAALATPEAQKRIRESGLVAVADRPADFARSLPVQAAKWQAIVKTLDLKIE
jgi:tripartite-type tricarboxylate transporter receptor subunit TctC